MLYRIWGSEEIAGMYIMYINCTEVTYVSNHTNIHTGKGIEGVV